MTESIELSTLAERSFEANDYESVRVSPVTDNEYVELKNVSEQATVQADPVYANTTLARRFTESTDADACTSSSHAHTSQSITSENKDTARTLHRTLAESLISLKRVQITCIVLGIALMACSATLGALMLTMRERLHQSEQVSDNMQVSIGKLQAQTGTVVSTNTTLQEHAMQLEKILNENSALINNHIVRIEALEQASVENKRSIQENIDSQLELVKMHNASKAVIRDFTTRIEHLEEASTDSTILIKSHTAVLLELERGYNTTKDVIEAHNTTLADLTQAIVDDDILIQNYTAKLSEIESAQVIQTAKIVELEKAIVDINIALLNYSYKFSEMDRYAFQVLRFKNVTYNGYDFLALEVRVPEDGLSRSPNWCYDYQYLCEDFSRRPTGCSGSTWTSNPLHSKCRDKYNSDMNIGGVLGCNPSLRIADVANIAFPNLSPPAQYTINAFGFLMCEDYCNKTLQASDHGLAYMRGFWQSNMTTFYTVCH